MARERVAPLEVTPSEFRAIGHALVERIASYLEALPTRAIVPTEIEEVRRRIGEITWHAEGEPLAEIAESAASLLLEHSTITSHPRFWGYINGAASPIAALADLLGTAANPNASAWYVGPVTSAMEEQVVHWLSELVGYRREGGGGTLCSGGSMANLVALATARHALAATTLRVYATRETHTWLAKAESFLGLAPEALRWIATEPGGRMSCSALRDAIERDVRTSGVAPTVIVATAGTTSTGAIDPIDELAALCEEQRFWLHVDGAYGAPAACVADAPSDLKVLGRAHSLVLDPHKWLYTSLEAGCVLVHDRRVLADAFTQGSPYYGDRPGELPPHYRDLGPQTSRGARAVKVWMCLRRAGRAGYAVMIGDDIALARRLFERAAATPRLEALTHNLSITTFRYLPDDPADADRVNTEIVRRLQERGEVYPSKTVVDGRVAIRACIVNFRTGADDLEALVAQVLEAGDAIR